MNKTRTLFCSGLALLAGSAQAQWENWGMSSGSSMNIPNYDAF